ncbi:MARVEL domain-containing protein [Caenorhabditis elegans]
MTAPYSTIIPYPSGAAWWYGLTAIVMYLLLFICAFYVLFTVAQVVFPDRIPFDLKMIVFIDVIFASIVTIMLLIAYAFFAGGYNGVTNIKLVGVGFGYCFWMAVASSIFSCSVVIISGLSWYRNN